ncbi:Protein of unknown function [Cotesia congregata]|uniref:Uncharacterized protein n=1 Tax=Cotesia congregata TaxID=51543 RepID=A0A8J2MPV6_COTCN|nr:Protein of unknown function [Cotesia congregata]
MSEQIGEKIYNYLIGFEIKTINKNKLPLYRDVLSLFMYKHHSLKQTIRNSSSDVLSEVNAVWAGFLIPTIRPQHSKKKLEKLYSEYIIIKKHRHRAKKSKAEQANVKKFCEKLDKLFDISNCAAVKNLPEGVRNFLFESQGKNCNKRLPVAYASPEMISDNQSAMEQDVVDEDNVNIEIETGFKLSQQTVLTSFSSNVSSSSELKRTCSDFEYEIPAPKMKKLNILTSELVSALDRTQTSDRNAMFIIAAVIKSLGLDVEKYNLSYSSIRNARILKREEIVDTIKKKKEDDESLVVHWDGKKLPTGHGTLKAERLAIHISGTHTSRILEAPDFVTKNSLFIFEQFDLPYGFLNSEPNTWETNYEYQQCLKTFCNLKVVNDIAERGVALAEKFNQGLTNNEEERQKIFQTVQNHRLEHPSSDMSSEGSGFESQSELSNNFFFSHIL